MSNKLKTNYYRVEKSVQYKADHLGRFNQISNPTFTVTKIDKLRGVGKINQFFNEQKIEVTDTGIISISVYEVAAKTENYAIAMVRDYKATN